MNVRLIIEQGPTKVPFLHLHSPETIIGRQKGCGLRIPSATVSRRHCVLRIADGPLTVEDLGSANGTFHNGRRVTRPEVVAPGDRLEIGPLVFVVDYAQAPSEEPVVAMPVEEFIDETPAPIEISPLQAITEAPGEDCIVVQGIPVLSEDEPVQVLGPGDTEKILAPAEGKYTQSGAS